MEKNVNNTFLRNSEEDDLDGVDSNERIYVIIGVVVALIALQTVGCIICYKDKWMEKRKIKKNQQSVSSPSSPIEITETLTTVRQPKKENARESETVVPFLAEQQQRTTEENVNVEESVAQIHETRT